MATSYQQNLEYPTEPRTNPVYYVKNVENSREKPQNVYLDFDDISSSQVSQVYSYATEATREEVSTGRSGGPDSANYTDRGRTPNHIGEPTGSSRSPLSESTASTGTTYAKIGEPNLSVDFTRVNRSHGTNKKRSSFSLGRIIVILTLLVAIITAGVLLYIFVFNRNSADDTGCNEIPRVQNGSIIRSEADEGSATVTVACEDGFVLDGNEIMTCNDNVWTELPECVSTECWETSSPNMFIGKSNIPNWLQFPDNIISGSTAIFKCSGEIGDPKGHIDVELNLNGSFSTVLTTNLDTDSNEIGFINQFTDEKSACGYNRTVEFHLRNVTSSYHQKEIRCVSRAVDYLETGQEVTSETRVLEVIPDTGCNEIPEVHNGTITSSEADEESTRATVVCEAGFVLDGNETMTCKDNIWSELPKCVPNECGESPSPNDIPRWLLIPDNIISGTTAIFKCFGEIGDPKGYIDVEMNLFGSFSILLTTNIARDSNEIGFINRFTDEQSVCGYNRTVEFRLRNVTSRYHQKEIRCVSRAVDYLETGQEVSSETRVMQVIPEDYCGPTDYTRPHPYRCDRFVLCSAGKVTGVPSGCAVDQCFNEVDNACYSCEQLGGCSVTDIYIDNYIGWIIEGDSATVICKVSHFEGLTDIVISKGDNFTVVAKLSEANFASNAVIYVVDETYIDESSGQLAIRIQSVRCKDGGFYQCAPVGTGKQSEDEISLAVRDSEGNTVC